MKKSALRERSESKGFTLIEILVVVSIIAILTIIAISLFIGVQAKGRDGRRQAEIDSLAKSIEALKNPTTQLYAYTGPNYDRDFPQTKPQDPKVGSRSYCIALSTTTAPPGDPSAATWPATGCPTVGWSPIPTATPATTDIISVASSTASWKVCAYLEASNTVFCKSSLTQ